MSNPQFGIWLYFIYSITVFVEVFYSFFLSWSYVYIFLHIQHSITLTTFFELQLRFLLILNVVFGFSKLSDFPSLIILHTPHLLFLHFETQCVLRSTNVDEVSMCLNLSLFSSYQRFLLLFLWIVLGCFCCMLRRILMVICCFVFLGLVVLLMVFFNKFEILIY